MINNPGGHIKLVAKAVFVMGMIGSIAGAILAGTVLENIFDSKAIVFLIGIACVLVGALITWIISLFLYSWGEVVESVAYLSEEHADALEEQNAEMIQSNKELLLELQRLSANLNNRKNL